MSICGTAEEEIVEFYNNLQRLLYQERKKTVEENNNGTLEQITREDLDLRWRRKCKEE